MSQGTKRAERAAAPAAPEAAPVPNRAPHPRGRLYASVLDAVGGTPIVLLPRIAAAEGLPARIGLKLEYLNPLGSVKDRIGLAMVEEAERAGLIAPGRSTLIEPTSGNTGIALAFIAAAKGYRLIVVMPDGASLERRKMMKLLGAELELTPAKKGMAGAIARAQEIEAKTKGAWMPRQFDNPANPAIHAATTAEEIWADTGGAVDAVVGGIGTGGTLTGIARALKPHNGALRVIGVEPAESAVLSGDEPGPHRIQGIGAGFRPGVLELEALDGLRRVSEREALAAARRCAREEGLPIGISSGAVLHAVIQVAREVPKGGLVVGIAASFAERYLSTELFEGL
ncbi:cysteine synthase A [Plastoroseomonas hellenica]|uniref:cysteine synthase A n=1 Tax=Plastoroseomonas hellenica TaxID=2687306 RepID=UPI001BAABEDF|nr:cysteine synthase A [Plastoroseomonas hellenica]MBR0645684.1 cysteine synthase A [Plastoroseomonas hellenica]